jgi:hypothetical protein
MTNKTDIFKHLNRTSLLTAPVFTQDDLDTINI